MSLKSIAVNRLLQQVLNSPGITTSFLKNLTRYTTHILLEILLQKNTIDLHCYKKSFAVKKINVLTCWKCVIALAAFFALAAA